MTKRKLIEISANCTVSPSEDMSFEEVKDGDILVYCKYPAYLSEDDQRILFNALKEKFDP